jgi:type IV secretory pathway VirB2 component (pilin)
MGNIAKATLSLLIIIIGLLSLWVLCYEVHVYGSADWMILPALLTGVAILFSAMASVAIITTSEGRK